MKLTKTLGSDFWYTIGKHEDTLAFNLDATAPLRVQLKRVTGEDDVKWRSMLEQGMAITRVCKQALSEKLLAWENAEDGNGQPIGARDVFLRELNATIIRDIGAELLGASEIDPEG